MLVIIDIILYCLLLSTYPTVIDIRRILTSCNHNGFPVVTQEGRLHGLILRKSLWVALRATMIDLSEQDDEEVEDVEVLDFTDHDDLDPVDIDSFVDVGCHIVFENCTISRAFALYQTLGLRHLPVIAQDGRVAGMLTRRSFLSEPCHVA
jgi:chloride channel 7